MKRSLMGPSVRSNQTTQPESTSTTATMPKWLKAYGYWIFFWAFMVAVSRIFVGKHYLGDVIVGILVGSLAGYCFARLASHIAHKTLK